jgi:hypothetical protein
MAKEIARDVFCTRANVKVMMAHPFSKGVEGKSTPELYERWMTRL